MRILSFDISANPGVALIEVKKGKPTLLAVYHLETDAKHTDSQRYAIIEAWATQFIYDNKATDAQVIREKFIKGGSKRATQLVFGAWSSIDRALMTFGMTAEGKNEIVASRVKKYVGGKGGAKKDEVADGVIRMIGEDVRPLLFTERGKLLDDRADAIAIGLAWAIENKLIKGAE